MLGTLRAQMRAEGSAQARDAIEAFERSCAAYFTREFSRAEPNVRAWVACDSEHVVATAVLMILPTLPRLDSQGAVDGRVRDVYVLPTHRRRGIARALMALVLDEARTLRVDRLSLGASVMGRPLYESLGFVAKRDEMVYERRF
ncbi:MAG: GNAT family N-acetyltransferase [Candidatus Eremiobacteraeota bacterium]|nr:GNAT family N-acetyltransferase [Candidatus Eremiobacteraeota bacterium]